jgi:uncharacterized protein with HEPN domain
MDKSGRSIDGLLADIVLWGERIDRYLADKTREDFGADEILQLAVTKCIEVIGEAPSNILRLHAGFADEHPELELVEAYRMRNRLSHGYDTIDWLIVWDTATADVPALISRARPLASDSGG